MTIKIVPISEDHWVKLPDIHRAAILAVPDKYYDESTRKSWATGLIPEGYIHSAEDGEVFHVALDDSENPIGFCGFRGYEITALFVAPQHQRKGVATALYNKAIDELLKGRPAQITLTTGYPALAFFEKQGFVTLQEREEITRGGAFMPVFDMKAPISSPPHTGREVELMRAGKKNIAYFEDNDPVEKFRPHLTSGEVKRFVWQDRADHLKQQLQDNGELDINPVAPVIYYLAQFEDQKDRLVALLHKHMIEGQYDSAEELEMGELLSYPSYAIKAFLERMRNRRED